MDLGELSDFRSEELAEYYVTTLSLENLDIVANSIAALNLQGATIHYDSRFRRQSTLTPYYIEKIYYGTRFQYNISLIFNGREDKLLAICLYFGSDDTVKEAFLCLR